MLLPLFLIIIAEICISLGHQQNIYTLPCALWMLEMTLHHLSQFQHSLGPCGQNTNKYKGWKYLEWNTILCYGLVAFHLFFTTWNFNVNLFFVSFYTLVFKIQNSGFLPMLCSFFQNSHIRFVPKPTEFSGNLSINKHWLSLLLQSNFSVGIK